MVQPMHNFTLSEFADYNNKTTVTKGVSPSNLGGLRLFSDVWSENVALFNRLMKIHSNPPILYGWFKVKPTIYVYMYMYAVHTVYNRFEHITNSDKNINPIFPLTQKDRK